MSRTKPAPHRLTRNEAAAETRERLLASAREVFVERGFQGASIYEISERAGRTIGSLYSHFGGKEGVFLALVDRHFAEQLERYSREVSEAEDSAAALRAGGEFWIRFLDQDPDVVVLFIEFWSYAMRDAAVRPRLASSYRKLRAALADLIEEQRRALEVTGGPSSTEAAIVFDALIDGFALHRLIDAEQVSQKLLPRALSWIAHGMLAEAQGAASPLIGPTPPTGRRREG